MNIAKNTQTKTVVGVYILLPASGLKIQTVYYEVLCEILCGIT